MTIKYLLKLMKGLLAVSILAISPLSFGQEATEEVKKEVHYFDLDPNVITNYQKKSSRRLGYITLDIQIQVSSVERLEMLDYHKALIDDALSKIINTFDEATIKDISARDKIRLAIKDQLTAALKEETGEEIVDDVFFTKFVYQ
ncbi:MAG: flagellar basal body-associated FliL family protein [Kangiellaceae bacterium]|nr:flagellar basal body-associated FliL family protein [Kangiellaceae bacterium]